MGNTETCMELTDKGGYNVSPQTYKHRVDNLGELRLTGPFPLHERCKLHHSVPGTQLQGIRRIDLRLINTRGLCLPTTLCLVL